MDWAVDSRQSVRRDAKSDCYQLPRGSPVPRIATAVEDILERGNVVAPLDVLVETGGAGNPPCATKEAFPGRHGS